MKMKRLWLVFASTVALALSQGTVIADDETLQEPTVKAKALRTPPPEYPEELRRREVEGLVLVVAIIDEKGAVADAEVTKSGNAELARYALSAVRKWKYKPAEKDGQPIRARVSIPIQFSLDN
jgi:periplasmic protein TonB